MPTAISGTAGVTIGSGAAYTFGDGSTQTSAADPADFGFKNRIINGAMVIDQRNAGASVTVTGGSGYYSCDRWQQWMSQNSKYSIQRSTTAPVGFINSLLATSLSAYSVVAADSFALNQNIEGLNIADLAWGTANAATVTLSFWVRSSLTGTFGGAISNSAVNRSYPFTYTISAANTFEYKTITIAGDTSGTWLTDNGIGIRLWFSIGAGSTYLGTAGAWAGADYRGATGQTSVVGTNGATFYITGVQLEKNTGATGFDVRPYGTELALCQRYCFVPASSSRYVGQCDATTRALIIYVFPQTMRSGPNATLASAATYNVTTAAGGTVAGTSVSLSGGFTDTAQVAISVASGLVAGNASLVTASGTTIFSAEL